MPALAVAVELLLDPAPPLALAGAVLPPLAATGAGPPPDVLELWVELSTGLLLLQAKASGIELKPENTASAETPISFSLDTWSFINAMSGEITIVKPS